MDRTNLAVERTSGQQPTLVKTTMREDVFCVAEGKVTFQWPMPMSADSIQDVQDWLELVKRKVGRADAKTAVGEWI